VYEKLHFTNRAAEDHRQTQYCSSSANVNVEAATRLHSTTQPTLPDAMQRDPEAAINEPLLSKLCLITALPLCAPNVAKAHCAGEMLIHTCMLAPSLRCVQQARSRWLLQQQQ
jgi:hypothetical protein